MILLVFNIENVTDSGMLLVNVHTRLYGMNCIVWQMNSIVIGTGSTYNDTGEVRVEMEGNYIVMVSL